MRVRFQFAFPSISDGFICLSFICGGEIATAAFAGLLIGVSLSYWGVRILYMEMIPNWQGLNSCVFYCRTTGKLLVGRHYTLCFGFWSLPKAFRCAVHPPPTQCWAAAVSHSRQTQEGAVRLSCFPAPQCVFWFIMFSTYDDVVCTYVHFKLRSICVLKTSPTSDTWLTNIFSLLWAVFSLAWITNTSYHMLWFVLGCPPLKPHVVTGWAFPGSWIQSLCWVCGLVLGLGMWMPQLP